MKIGIDIFGPVVSDLDTEFTSLYGVMAALSLRYGHSVYVSSDSADETRAKRQNSRHLNLVLLCLTSHCDHGAILIDHRTSALNRRRAMKAAAVLAGLLGYPFTVKEATPKNPHYPRLRGYRAFVWAIEAVPNESPFKVGLAISDAVEYAYGHKTIALINERSERENAAI